MKRQTRQGCIVLLISIVVSAVALDGLLRLFDPWGAVRYAADNRILIDHMTDQQPRGYTVLPGAYTFSDWIATINADGTRNVPDTNSKARCTIALVGDSVTFGYGVSDADTFANLLARQFPDVNIINTGVNGYNVEDVARVIHNISADGYIYLMINNDAEPPLDWRHAHTGSEVSAVSLYFLLMKKESVANAASPVRESFYQTLGEIQRDKQVTIVGFDQPLVRDAAIRYPSINVIPNYTGFNSRADPHPNAAGSREIARMLAPFVAQAAACIPTP